MSVVSFVLSSRSSSSRYKVNDRLASIMDSIFAIGAGLGLRFLVDAASRHSFKITGTLVGLWEGVILLHFLKKAPRSFDPFIAYGVRLFIDFLVTESIGRLVLVIIWTCLGMVLADISPVFWNNTGLRRVWRRIRRDLYTLSEMIPTVVFTSPPRRTVRFSPSRMSSAISEVASDADVLTEAPSMYTPSVATELLPPSSIIPTTTLPTTAPPTTITMTATEVTSRRRLPGYLPGMLSDTESMVSSILGRGRPAPTTTTSYDPSRTSRRLSVFPTRDYDSASSVTSGSPSQHGEEIDDDNDEYTTTPSSQSSEMQEQATTAGFDISQMTEIPDEEELLPITSPPGLQVQMTQTVVVKEEMTPTPRHPIPLPPTPSDSQATRRRQLPRDEPVVIPTIMPQIPDEEGAWEGSRRSGAPSPPAKDWPHSSTADNTPRHFDLPTPDQSRVIPRHQGPGREGWDLFASQFMEKPAGYDEQDEKRSLKSNDDKMITSNGHATPNGNGHTPVRRQSTQPPAYATWEHVDTSNIDDIYGDEVNEKSTIASPVRPDAAPTRDSFAAFAEQLERDEAAKAQKQRDEMERVRFEQEAAKLQQQKVEEEIRQREEEERQKAEEERLRVEAEEQRLREMEKEMDRRAAAFAAAEAEALRHAQQEERKRREAEAEVLRLKLAEEERLRREAEAEVQRLRQEAVERTRREEEAERLRREAEAEAIRQREEEERLRHEAKATADALRLQREADEEEKRQAAEAEAESLRLQQEEEEMVRREAEAEALRLKEEKEEERLRRAAEAEAEAFELERLRLEAEEEAESLRVQQEEEERLRVEAEAKAAIKAEKAAKKAKKLEKERKKAEKEERWRKEEEDAATREQNRLEAEEQASREEQERAAALAADEAERQRAEAEAEEMQRLEELEREKERQEREAEEDAQKRRIEEENERLRRAQEQEDIERLRHAEEEETRKLEAIRVKAEEDDHRRLEEERLQLEEDDRRKRKEDEAKIAEAARIQAEAEQKVTQEAEQRSQAEEAGHNQIKDGAAVSASELAVKTQTQEPGEPQQTPADNQEPTPEPVVEPPQVTDLVHDEQDEAAKDHIPTAENPHSDPDPVGHVTPTAQLVELPVADRPPTPPPKDADIFNLDHNIGAGDDEEERDADVNTANELEQQRMETETVLTMASSIPDRINERLQRVILTKAQIFEIQERIKEQQEKLTQADETERANVEATLQATEKVLRKMQRKELRRSDMGVQREIAPSPFDKPNFIVLESLTPGDAKKRVQEKLEELLTPEASSLDFSFQCKVGKPGKKQKQAVVEILESYGLFSYSNEDPTNGRLVHIQISEDVFPTWLLEYRRSITHNADE